MILTTVIFFGVANVNASDLSNEAFAAIAANYKACIKEELIASTNEDGSLDEVFFLVGKEHCEKMQKLKIETKGYQQQSRDIDAEISAMTDSLISGAKEELGLK